jgi:hypothetical protein
MAKGKLNVGLYLRYRTPEGKQSPPRPVAWDSKSRLRPGWCMVGGVAEHHPNSLMRGLIKQSSCARDGDMIRCPLIQSDQQKLPQTQRIGQSPTRCHVRSRSLRKTQSASPENTSPAPDAPTSRDRTSGSALRRTHRSLPRPALRSAADRKDGPELPLDPDGTKAFLAADAVYAFPSPYPHSTLNHFRRKVISSSWM